MSSNTPSEPLLVFISYSHKDENLREELEMHLSNLKRQGKIKAWHDRAIEAGAEWDAEIKANLESAHVILLLISPRFMASEYCYDIEMQRAMERNKAGTARVIPIILKPVDWKDTPFSELKVLPLDGKPINTWNNQDEAFLNVVQGIRRAVEELKKQSTSQANSRVSPPSVEVEQELNESDREILTDLLIRSGRAEYSARRALCIKIEIDPNQLEFLKQSSDNDFAVELIERLHIRDDKQAICKICKELEIVFKRGKYSADLENIKSKINCK